MSDSVLQQVAGELRARGLLYLGSVFPNLSQDKVYFQQWLAEGRHGSMNYLEQHDAARDELQAILPGAKSVIMFALKYDAGDKADFGEGHGARIAQYARIKDYHKLMRQLGTEAMQAIADVVGGTFRVCVDTAPIFERAVAAQVGQGFIGKNTCYIDLVHGSFLLLGEIVSDQALGQPPAPTHQANPRSEQGGCGTCRRCQVHCPTGALDKDYTIDARRCLSYLTIEHRGLVDEEFWPAFAKYWYGCDICQLVCPYNRGGELAVFNEAWKTHVETLDLAAVTVMTEKEYQAWFGGTPMTRAKRNGLRRNAMISLTMRRDPRIAGILEQNSRDDNEVVRETSRQLMQWRERNDA